jgi:hypothetical protein
MTKKKRRTSAGVTIGGIVAGIEQQIFRTTPPVNELVAKGTPLRAIAASDGGTLDVTFPDDAPSVEERANEHSDEGSGGSAA